jgi:hypothetical protein
MPTRTTTLLVVALCVGVCAACGVVLAVTGNGGFAGVAAAIAAAALRVGVLVGGLLDGLRELMRASERTTRELEEVRVQLRTMDQHLELLRASSALSERAKSVLSRSQERMLLTQAIEDDINAARFASTVPLLRQLESLGAHQDAAALAAKTREAQQRALLAPPAAQVTVDSAVDQLGQQQAENLAQQVKLKAGLEQAFHLAAKEGRTDDAMMVLGQLDSLITPEEATPLREIARDVIAKARDGLGEKFRLAIQEKRWKDAIACGEQITRQFPNTRMASEVTGMLDALRTRATD